MAWHRAFQRALAMIEELFCRQELLVHECILHVVISWEIRELSMKLCLEEQKSHLAILTLGEQVRWVVPILFTTYRAVTRDCHEVVNP